MYTDLINDKDNERKTFSNSLVKIVGIPTIFFILSTAITHFQFLYIEKLRLQHQNTTALKLNISEYVRLLVDMETGCRGYVLTHDKDFLDPYYEAINAKSKIEDNIFSMTVNDYVVQKEFRDLQKSSDEWINSVAKPSIDNIDAGNKVQDKFRVQGKINFDQIRKDFKILNNKIDIKVKLLLEKLNFVTQLVYMSELIIVFLFVVFLYLLLKKQFSLLTGTYRNVLEKNDRQFKKIKEASNAKDLFLANMSHEIRTPLGAVIGFADLALEDSNLKSETRSHITFIKRNGSHLLDLVEDLFDLSKVEKNKIEIFEEPTQLNLVLVDIENNFSSRLNDNKQEFNTNIIGDLPVNIITDEMRLKQILINLIGNAIKFTNLKGKIDLNVSVSYDDKMLCFDVIDNGIGIVKEKQEVIFDLFKQVDENYSRKFGGAGLGLSISRTLARKMGGDLILISSQPHVGSHFRFTLPMKNIDDKKFNNLKLNNLSGDVTLKEDRIEVLNRSLSGIKVLLAEDSIENQVLFRIYLESSGAEVKVVGTGADAVKNALNYNYDIVIMDIQMPGLDGYEALKILKDSHYSGIIMALTAHAMKGEKDKALNSGFDAYLSKPVTKSKLIEQILSLIDRN